MWINWSAARGGRCERNAWSVSCISVTLSPGELIMRSSSACCRRSAGVCSSAARFPNSRASCTACCTSTGCDDAASTAKPASSCCSSILVGASCDMTTDSQTLSAAIELYRDGPGRGHTSDIATRRSHRIARIPAAIRSVRYRRMSRIEITPASLPSKRIGRWR